MRTIRRLRTMLTESHPHHPQSIKSRWAARTTRQQNLQLGDELTCSMPLIRINAPTTLTGLPHMADVISENICVPDLKAVDFRKWEEPSWAATSATGQSQPSASTRTVRRTKLQRPNIGSSTRAIGQSLPTEFMSAGAGSAVARCPEWP